MIIFVYGTSAEAIKLAPVAKRLTERGIPYESWLTMFHGDSLVDTLDRLDFNDKRIYIPNGNSAQTVRSIKQTLKWLFWQFKWVVKNKKNLQSRLSKNSIIIVHGDTLTTVIGTIYAKILKIPSAHVEAGLRSGNWRHPFPEELDRRIAGKLATIHYVPSKEAVNNLSGKQNVVYTHGNTVIDSVLDATESLQSHETPYGVCLLHRFEFLSNKELVAQTIDVLAENTPKPIWIFVDDYSGSFLDEIISNYNSPKIFSKRKLPYVEFVKVLKGAEFVFTDSGGIQAECAMLGIPTMIHRKTTEQNEGVGENIILSDWKIEAVEYFLGNYESYKRSFRQPTVSPSQIIIEDLNSRGFLLKAKE